MARTPHATGAFIEDPNNPYPEFEAVGGDWDKLVKEAEENSDEHVVINLGPVHPATHGVLRSAGGPGRRDS